MGRTGLKKLQL